MRSSEGSMAAWFLVILYVILAGFQGLGSYALIEPDEPRYAQSSLEMIVRGSPLVPLLGGEPRINKPPLLYWSIMASYAVLGVNEFSARLPSALSGLITAVFVYLLTRDIFGRRAALFSIPVLYSMPLFFAAAHLAITDMMLTAFLTAAFYFWWRWRQRERTALMMLSWTCVGLAFLTKGPVSVILFVLTVLVTAASTGQRQRLRRFFHWSGMLLFLAMAVSWPLAVMRTVPGAWELWWHETILRYAEGVDHDSHVLFPLAAVAGGSLPWFAVCFPARWPGFRNLWAGLKCEPGKMFIAMWVAVVVVFFALSRSQIFTYVLPAMPPIAVGAGGMLAHYTGLKGGGAGKPLVRAAIAGIVLGCGALAYGLSEGAVPVWAVALSVLAMTAGTVLFGILITSGRSRGAALLMVFLVCGGTLLGGKRVFERLGALRSFDGVARDLAPVFGETDEVLFCGPVRYSLSFYGGLMHCRGVSAREAALALEGDLRVAVLIRGDNAAGHGDAFTVAECFEAGVVSGDAYVCLLNFIPQTPVTAL